MTIILGIEGTAWNLSAAIVNEEDVIVDVTHTYKPAAGGIHPREAAQHHAAHVGEVIDELFRLFEEKGYSKSDIDAVAFSKGPGLGPCLRIVGTAARMVSLMLEKPLVGVNHCVAHIEVGLWKTEATDPITLYVSGANSQVLAYEESESGTDFGKGAYRVFGETLDIGLGNSLDKFARSAGLPHPGGPLVEKYAKEATEYIDLPYTVKGMDFFFSGLSTAATRYLKENTNSDGNIDETVLANACYAYQETAFAMAVEVTERALAHTGKNEVLLAGGVGANSRIREMLEKMCADRGAKFFVPEKKFMGDNGAMIAYTGLLMFKAGDTLTVEESFVDAGFRPDEVSVTWKPPKNTNRAEEIKKMQNGAEAVVHTETKSYGFEKEFNTAGETEEMVVKERIQKNYRLPQIDAKLRKDRTRTEVRMLTEARRCGVPAPIVYGVDDFAIKMEYINGTPLKFEIDTQNELAAAAGEMIGKLHASNIIHGDLTTSNMIAGRDSKLYLIDFGLSFSENSVEAKGVDIHVLFQTFDSSHKKPERLKELFAQGYRKNYKDADIILKRAEEIKMRGRYIEGR
ncbi:bifunctional N(6)-L-threonylcarbamoyladenine synthase/serine/threonine protein kinase [Methanimicrococcus blatticola]|uniref:tRNA N6-adenosine threonylcarbamoyltransferase n=1 Tax=Methanimicrococcus blatticola TaxID=91560 RepID=A0A484F603_9EURY|nr:bifunctional N(6)-L-threonylcarbamoyladenine synthase/serine/threonine protein kinase [Methanimicrococcus blatticola]MBZ3936067.1 bifunctional N(6)-L-threonylcarbamoyladenine synthase/serine/threonine protein kinase [Methanimicrococcus blatticola]MCC2509322.1 bifunctional N(6)-L-threonylcarbamoyladenine synthase/serine/threonine protein kinase [Methanimicrococcus blatticola]TDQ68207.1 O-sialoglycoprotein endopeptidase [Methanimicrococcus blatticola]